MTINVGRVGMIPLESVVVGERTREIMGDLDSLEDNMKESGLISPLAVRDNKDGSYLLLAGERRFSVLQKNSVANIPVRIYDQELTDLEMKIIEKSENFHRKDMEYWEFDRLTLEIHQMQQELHGVKAPGPGSEGWSTEDTGEIIGGATKGAVSMSIKRATAREAFPDLFDNCKTANDASTLLKKMDEAVIRQTIAQRLEMQTSDSNLNQLSKCFIVKDFFEGVKDIPDGIMHLVEIDPPYSINLRKQKRSEGESQYQLEDYNEIDMDKYQVFLAKTLAECYRVMQPHSWLICWFAPEPWFESIYRELNNAGFTTTRMCGIWTKGGSGQSKRAEIRLANTYEMFFYAWKGRPALNKAGRSNEFRFSPIPSQQKTHPTERPIELMNEIYNTFAFTGSRVLIPFLGSGNGLIAAHQLGMSGVGFELSKSYKDSFLVKVHGMK